MHVHYFFVVVEDETSNMNFPTELPYILLAFLLPLTFCFFMYSNMHMLHIVNAL